MRTVDLADAMRYPPAPGVDFGKLVKVNTIEGSSDSFRVTQMNDQGIGSNDRFYRYQDMESLKVESKSNQSTETASVIMGILGVAALVWLIGNSDSVTVCSPPCQTPDP